MTDRQTQAVAEAIRKDMQIDGEWYHDNDIDCLSTAQAAIAASDAKYVKGLVDMLKALLECQITDENGIYRGWRIAANPEQGAGLTQRAQKIREELAALPEDIRNG